VSNKISTKNGRTKAQTMIYKTLHRKVKPEQQEHHKNGRTKGQTMIYNILHRKVKTEQQDPH
jgi:hypothetical protein